MEWSGICVLGGSPIGSRNSLRRRSCPGSSRVEANRFADQIAQVFPGRHLEAVDAGVLLILRLAPQERMGVAQECAVDECKLLVPRLLIIAQIGPIQLPTLNICPVKPGTMRRGTIYRAPTKSPRYIVPLQNRSDMSCPYKIAPIYRAPTKSPRYIVPLQNRPDISCPYKIAPMYRAPTKSPRYIVPLQYRPDISCPCNIAPMYRAPTKSPRYIMPLQYRPDISCPYKIAPMYRAQQLPRYTRPLPGLHTRPFHQTGCTHFLSIHYDLVRFVHFLTNGHIIDSGVLPL